MMAPRWKGKGAESKALADPMSSIVSNLHSSLLQSNSTGSLVDSTILFEANAEKTDLLNRACFGRPRITAQKVTQWFEFSLEEAFYLCCSLKCITIVDQNQCQISVKELWEHMTHKRDNFPLMCKAYCHLRSKNWVVRSGSQYGVDFVAYRHHPALVHSEYAVLVFPPEGGGRLRVWSDYHCTLRLCGSVAKTLLVLYVEENNNVAVESPWNLDNYVVEERIVTRWSPEQCREDKVVS
ncbi:hypothetical protein DM860_006265 [Cuscuta australis]|uniref:tRNA-intron lyase n=1 Tax=Cuscuta australis TaxID=267555 RepID=A0A328DPF7_9ASTE|nr:hypothetical protein DM860_006265 [Cuscuta australis]